MDLNETPPIENGARSANRRVLANAGWLYLDQATRAIVVLVAFGMVARSLGPERFGVLSYAIAFPAVFLPIAMLGLDYVIVRDLVRHFAARNSIISTALVLRGAGAILAMSSAWAFVLGWLPSDDPARTPVVVAILTLGAQPFLTFDFYFQSRIASRAPVLVRIATCLLGNGTRIYLATCGAPVVAYAWVLVVEGSLNAAGFYVAYRASGAERPKLLLRFEKPIAARLLRAAWPLFLADVAIAFYQRFDQVLLRHLTGPETLGFYAGAFRLSDAAQFFIFALVNSYFPRLIAFEQQDQRVFMRELTRFWQRITWLALAIALLITVGAQWFVPLVLGPSYTGTIIPLVLLGWNNVFVAQIAVRGKWFLLRDKQYWSLAFFVIGAIMHLSLLPILAPRFGAVGAASSLLTAHIAMVVLAPLAFRATRPAGIIALQSLFRPAK